MPGDNLKRREAIRYEFVSLILSTTKGVWGCCVRLWGWWLPPGLSGSIMSLMIDQTMFRRSAADFEDQNAMFL